MNIEDLKCCYNCEYSKNFYGDYECRHKLYSGKYIASDYYCKYWEWDKIKNTDRERPYG